jgi:hypothetical protein
MPKPGESKDETVERVMHEYKQGDLKSSSGDKVKSRNQAIAIGISESGQSYKDKGSASHHRREHGHTGRHH